MNEANPPLLQHFLDDLYSPDVVWQIGVLVFCLLLAVVFARHLRKRAETMGSGDSEALRIGRGGLRRLAFPVTALLLVVVARAFLVPWMKVNLLNVALALFGAMAVVRLVVYMLRHAFPGSAWLTASERWVAALIWGALALYLSGLAAPLIELLESVRFKFGKDTVDLWILLNGIVMVLVTILVALWAGGMIEARLAKASQIDSSLRVVLGRLAKALFTVLALLLSLALVGIDVTALSVFGGALGVGLGFGLQKIASNYVSGFIILLDRSIRIGNLISVDAETAGVVTEITTRYTVLRTLEGIEYIVPNEVLVSNIVQNQSFSDTRVRLKTRLAVAYASDIEMVIPLLEEIARAAPRVLADPAPSAQLIAFGDSGLELELGFWIDDPEDGTRNVTSTINREILRRFRKEGIEIPFPQREVRILGALEPRAAPNA